jgi:hypothetical protein
MAGLMIELRILTGAEAMLMAFSDRTSRWWLLRLVEQHGKRASEYARVLQGDDPPNGSPLRRP